MIHSPNATTPAGTCCGGKSETAPTPSECCGGQTSAAAGHGCCQESGQRDRSEAPSA